MLDAVRICGRWVCRHVLDRLTARSTVEHPPSRAALVESFCKATHWRDRKGRLCLSSAKVALKRLEERGLVRLPPSARRCPRERRRQLWDDGKALPPVPRLAPSVEGIPGLRLHRLTGAKDPLHGLWNRLVGREHPLKRAPLVGAQVRYLIVCGEEGVEGYLGAFGFGPASYHLDCRDRWIGWQRSSRQAHLSRVIGLSRFLIRPGVHCANLASRCYRLALSQVAHDWEQSYGVRPLLVETFVDRSTRTGVSLAAANWQRLGQSQGRGRSSPSARIRPESIKDVWVYELTSKARALLQTHPAPTVTPRSVFHGFAGNTAWTEQELDGLELGSVRLERRFAAMLASRWEKPGRSFGSSFATRDGKAAYRFLGNRQAGVDFESLLAPHRHQTHRRMAAESLILLAQDTTTLSYNTLRSTRGLGRIGDRPDAGRGLLLHTLHAFRTDAIPLGCAWARLWARPPESDTAQRNEQSIADKESSRWLEAYQTAVGLARSMPGTRLVVCGDRESDIFELFDSAEVAPANLRLLVRAQHDRGLESGGKLWGTLGAVPVGGTFEVVIPRQTDRPARQATLSLRWCPIEVAPPRVALKKSWSAVRLYAVMAREVDPPTGIEPIEWVLLTDWKVDSAKLAQRMVQWYGLRWGIECWHQVLKGVCGVETRSMKSAAALERALVLDMIVAWRARLLCRLAKQEPNQPASLQYTPEELSVLEAYREKLPRWARSLQAQPTPPPGSVDEASKPPPFPSGASPEQAPGGPPSQEPLGRHGSFSLLQANLLVAMLGGFWGRKGDGYPGPTMIGRGLMVLAELVRFSRLTADAPPPRLPTPREPNRKPG